MNKYYGTVVIKRVNPDNELRHWKYTKREKVKGKWRYWYDDMKDKLGVDEKQALEAKTEEHDKAVAKKKVTESLYKDQLIRIKYDSSSKEKTQKFYNLSEELSRDKTAVSNLEKEVDKLTKEFANTPLGKLDKTIEKGSKVVADFLGITERQTKKAVKQERKEREEEKIRLDLLEDEERKRKKEREQVAKRQAAIDNALKTLDEAKTTFVEAGKSIVKPFSEMSKKQRERELQKYIYKKSK